MNRHFSWVLAILFCLALKTVSAADTVSLAGEWRFALDRSDAGTNENWFAKDLADKIQLPGILQAQGYGDDIRTDTPWVLSLGEAWWKIQPAKLREHFSQPGHVEVPFLSQPPKHYLGAAWYQRDLDIPTNWSGKHFTLFLERAHWQSKVWIDDQEFPANDSLVAPHITDLGILTPGKHRLSIRVDNRLQLPAAGHLVDSHSLSDGLGAAWNGIVGKIELRATSPVWIDDVQVFPVVSNRTALIKIKIGNLTGKEGSGTLDLGFTPGFPPGSKVRYLRYVRKKYLGRPMKRRLNLRYLWKTNRFKFGMNSSQICQSCILNSKAIRSTISKRFVLASAKSRTTTRTCSLTAVPSTCGSRMTAAVSRSRVIRRWMWPRGEKSSRPARIMA